MDHEKRRREILDWAIDWAATLDGEAAALRASAEDGGGNRAEELVFFARVLDRAARRVAKVASRGRAVK